MKKRFLHSIYILLYSISPKLLLHFRFLLHYSYYKKFLSFKNPITLDEKIQCLKLGYYKNNNLITQCADKYAVREYIKSCNCSEILIELYGVYNKVEDIPWQDLPNKFILKWNFGCGQNLICRNKNDLDIDKTVLQVNNWRKYHNTFYKYGAEMQYKNIEPKIIIERLIETKDGGVPIDYKVYCFHGKPYCVLTCANRDSNKTMFYFVDKDWNLLRLNKAGQNAPNNFSLPRPNGYEKIFEYAEKLAKPFPFVRADFYIDNGQVIFGELTFSPANGFDNNRLIETNVMFGSMLDISSVM